jgi:hypothetical protein
MDNQNMTLNLRSDFCNSRRDLEFGQVIALRAKRRVGAGYPDPGSI